MKRYKIHKTPAKHNTHKVDTYRIMYNTGKTYHKGIGNIEHWNLASDKLFFNLEDAEKELKKIKNKEK